MSERLTILLTHQAEPLVEAMVAWWQRHAPGPDILIAYGGTRERFEALRVPEKVFVDDSRLRTRDHQRERQSFAGVFSAVNGWLRHRQSYRLIHLSEFDCIPLCGDIFGKLEARLAAEDADILGCRLERLDGTNHPHYLYHSADPSFAPFLNQISMRKDRAVVLSMLGCVSFWKRGAFTAVADAGESPPLYLEIAMPTLAHHLGFRVRGLGDQSAWVQPAGNLAPKLDALRAAGAWMAHPVKDFWEEQLRTGARP
ncbi:MAG TPA: hypothetical protein VG796_28680 [Verrucomicrobiales bacterium]|jgi:hypothetical protein|nr:hypothetical protein [Verrucomicrobiales bacterium]